MLHTSNFALAQRLKLKQQQQQQQAAAASAASAADTTSLSMPELLLTLGSNVIC